MQEKKQSLVPELRFPGFEGEWEEKKFKDITIAAGKKNKQNLPYERYSISNELGFYPQSDQFEGGGGYLKNIDCSLYIIVPPHSFAYNPARINVGSIGYQNLDKDVIVSSLYEVFQTTDCCDDNFLWHWFHSDIFHRMILDFQEGGVRQYFFYDKLCSCSILLPTLPEQQKIAECLNSVDDLIREEADQLQALKDHKKGLMQQLFPQAGETTPKLRFPGFEGEWGEKKLGDVCNSITPPLKLQSNAYLSAGKYPVIDQSQSLICGWTNDDDGLITNVPVIVFGDHTCALKYIDFPFVQGADGVKILSPKNGCNPQFVYQAFVSNPVKQDGYKRHFSDFKEKIYYFPTTLPEQQKIADCLSSLDEEIKAQQQKVEALKEHKKGLMQKLFPAIN